MSTSLELHQLEEQRPELAAWLRPLRTSLASLGTGTWANVLPLYAQHRAADAPVLHDAVVPIDPHSARAHVRAVLQAALGSEYLARARDIDEVQLLDRALARDDGAIESPALRAAAQLAAIPLLIVCTRSAPPVTQWAHGYCHVCGAPPVLAELLGLERIRQLRCGRCGAGWRTNVLRCPFCSETDHARLGSLVPEGPQGQICWAETCDTCMGYIKTRAALRGMAAENVLIEDARTIDLDFVAVERGYQKPADGGYAIRVQLAAGGVS